MILKTISRTLVIVCIVFVNIGCDQVSKKIVRKNILANETINYLNNHFTITNVENTGAFLSLGDSLPKSTKKIVFLLFPILALASGALYLISKRDISKMTLIGLCFIIGGGIGNIFDRLIYGSVTDFLYVHFDFVRTGIFNLADVSVTVGALLILYRYLMKRKYST